MQRQREVAVDDEEELLRLQERFSAEAAQGGARPAAKVTRIARPQPARAAAAAAASGVQHVAVCSEHGPGCSGNHTAAPAQVQQAANVMAALQQAMKDIMGDVQERAPAPPAPPAPPLVAAAAAAADASGAFPEATHRKLSKFALGRQRQRAGAAPAPPVQPPVLPASMDEGSRMDAENRQLLAAMTPEQLEDAREEALKRLPASTVEFLRRRGAQKAAAAAAAPSAPAPAVEGSSGVPANGPKQQGGVQGRRAAQQPAGRQSHHQQQQQQQQASIASNVGAAQAGLVARLRFGVDGSVVGLRPKSAGTGDVAPADVAERDPIRQEGSEGYTIQEACLLARSSLPQQRVLALRLLGAVLALSRPRPSSPAGGGRVPLPVDVQQEQLAPASPAELTWLPVWHHALHAADVTLLLRRSLDDQHAAVAAAAAEALAALLGAAGPAAEEEGEAAEAADACPLTGWPAPPLRHLQRPTPGSAWVAAPTSAKQQRQLSGQAGAGEDGEEEEEAVDEQQLAKVDPLSGLLHMQLLDRAVYLIVKARVAAALDPLLSILIRCCQAGKDVADQVADTPGMLAALKVVLDAPPPAPAAEGALEGSTDAAAGTFYAARPKALRVLRQLVAASKAAARRLQESGLVRFALEQLLRDSVAPLSTDGTAAGSDRTSGGATSSSVTSLRQRGMLTEALRTWRSFAQHGFFLLSFDDAYATLCHFLAPPAGDAASWVAGAELPSADAVQRWCLAREAYTTAAQLCWHAAGSEAHDAQISPQCAAALAAGALGWLAELPLQHVLDGCLANSIASTSSGSSTSSGQPGAAGAGVAGGVRMSAYPAVAAAAAASAGSSASLQAVVLGTLAAALHFVGSYWSVQVWHTPADKAAAADQLRSLGLLPAAEQAGSSGAAPLALPLQAVSGLLGQLIARDAACSPWGTSSSSTGGSMSGPAQLAAAAGASASAELAVSLARLAVTFLPQQHASTSAAALLAPLCSQHAAERFRHTAEAADATLSQPWDAARQQLLLPLARAAVSGLQAAALAAKAQDQPLPAAAISTSLALLQLLPAGDEASALQLLALVLGTRQLGSVTTAAAAALQTAAAAGGKAAWLAADSSGGRSEVGRGPSGPPAAPPADQMSRVLLAGYAAAWLGLVPEQEEEGQEERAQQGQAQGAAASPLEPPPTATLLRPQGSRLPLPPNWALAEAPLPPAEAGVAADPATAAGMALLLALGWEEQQLRSVAVGAPPVAAVALAEQKLHSAVFPVFGEPAEAAAGVVPGAAAGQAEEERVVWQEPLVRWCLAALLERCCSAAAAGLPGGTADAAGGAAAACVSAATTSSQAADGSAGCAPAGSGQPEQPCWRQQEARQLAQHFAASSYGDALFGAAVALLLRHSVPADTQLEALSVLAEEQALHLLPPLHTLPGPAAAYLGTPTHSGSTAGFGTACFGGATAPGGGSGGGSSRRQELDLYVKLLCDGPLERCLAAGSGAGGSGSSEQQAAQGDVEGDGAALADCSAAVPIVLHRLACACFPDTSSQDTAGAAQQGLLCGMLQRCAGASEDLLRLLGYLLRWDTSAGSPSDVIGRDRLQAIQAACGLVGVDAGSLLQSTVEA